MSAKMTVVYQARTIEEAGRLQERLSAAGLAAHVNERAAVDPLGVPRDWNLPDRVPVAVDETDLDKARPIVRDFLREIGHLTVIYEARTVPEAQDLQGRLLAAGILAVMGSELSEGETTSDVWGLPVPARVAVDAEQAVAARKIALEFDAEVIDRVEAEAAREQEPDVVEEEANKGEMVAAGPMVWPRCPECDTPRMTRCPACKTTGSELRRAEMPEGSTDLVTASALVLCPECDEPFVPHYARHCQSCGHRFPDGFEDRGMPRERLTSRVVLALLAFASIIATVLLYFGSLLN